jgi:hypothetical protein
MKNLCLALIVNAALVLGLATISSLAPAQDREPPANSQASRGNAQPPSPEEVVDLLGTKLNLTDQQKSQMVPIIADRQQKLQALRSDTSMRRLQKMRKMKGIFADSDKKINAILNDEQRQQYAQIEQQIRQEIKDRRQNR